MCSKYKGNAMLKSKKKKNYEPCFVPGQAIFGGEMCMCVVNVQKRISACGGQVCVLKIIDGDLAVSEQDRLRCFKKIPSESLIA
jgi:hypothetical protein